jgi:hypothetical protein
VEKRINTMRQQQQAKTVTQLVVSWLKLGNNNLPIVQ